MDGAAADNTHVHGNAEPSKFSVVKKKKIYLTKRKSNG